MLVAERVEIEAIADPPHVEAEIGVERPGDVEIGNGEDEAVQRMHRDGAFAPRRRTGCRFHRSSIPVCRGTACRCRHASTTVSAVMLTIRRTVADGVRMCTGFATPSRIGPSVTPLARRDLEQVERDVRGVHGRHDQQVRLALQPRAGKRAHPHLLVQRGVAVHLALDLEVRIHHVDERERRLHLLRLRVLAAAEARMRQQRHLRRDAEAADLVGGEQRDLGDLLGRRIDVDVGVRDEHRPVRQHHRVHRRADLVAAAQADHLLDVAEVQRVRAERAAEHAVGLAHVDHHRADQREAAAASRSSRTAATRPCAR